MDAAIKLIYLGVFAAFASIVLIQLGYSQMAKLIGIAVIGVALGTAAQSVFGGLAKVISVLK